MQAVLTCARAPTCWCLWSAAEVLAAPESHLLAARPLRTSANVGGDEVVLFSDPRVRVADALDAGGHGGGFGSPYSLRSGAGAGGGGRAGSVERR